MSEETGARGLMSSFVIRNQVPLMSEGLLPERAFTLKPRPESGLARLVCAILWCIFKRARGLMSSFVIRNQVFAERIWHT